MSADNSGWPYDDQIAVPPGKPWVGENPESAIGVSQL